MLSRLNAGRVTWQREEALASIKAVEMVDLPAADQSESTESFIEFSLHETNPLKLLSRRLRLQAGLAGELLAQLKERGVAAVVQLSRGEARSLVRDHFNIRKLILAATDNGKVSLKLVAVLFCFSCCSVSQVYALDSAGGGVVWQSFHRDLLPFSGGLPLLYVLRTTSHPPHPPLAVLLGRSKVYTLTTIISTPLFKTQFISLALSLSSSPGCLQSVECDGSLLLPFNPLTGESFPSLCLPPLLQAVLLPTTDAQHSKILLMLSNHLEVCVY